MKRWQFINTLIKTVDVAKVWIGARDTLPMVAEQDISVIASPLDFDRISLKTRYVGPVPAPIAKGDELGALIISVPGLPDAQYPLLAGEPVARGGLMAKFRGVAAIALQSLKPRTHNATEQ